MTRVRDADGDEWDERPDGTWRVTYPDGSYRQEANREQLTTWWGPLVEVVAT
jgi:hypothetical protein